LYVMLGYFTVCLYVTLGYFTVKVNGL
jgi:hypothetical protein